MTTKEWIQTFIPPIYFLIKRKIKYGIEMGYKSPSDKQQLYDFTRKLNQHYNIPLTDISELSKEVLGLHSLAMPMNDDVVNYYGSWYAMQAYAGYPFFNLPPKKLTIQHGITYEMLNCELKHADYFNLVWSEEVVNMHRKYTDNPHIYAVGAPFYYASSILSEMEIQEERKRLGRNVLAFPMHSTYNINKEYDPQSFLRLLNQLKSSFDTVRVCVYWKDVQRGTAKVYQDAGFECVCSGHIADQAFHKRQRALLEIADATVSNAIGSHVGYSTFMNKPHWLVPDEFELVDIRENEGTEEMDMTKTSPNYKEIYTAFLDNPEFKITEEQRRVVDKYWGTSCVKSPEEMRTLIEKAYEISDNI